MAAVLGLVALLAVGPGLMPGRTPVPLDVLGLFLPWKGNLPPPENPILGDPVLQFSARQHVSDAAATGRLPLWQAGVFSGHPFDGDTQGQPFFPLHLVPAALLSPHTAFGLQMVLQLWLAGLFMAAWVRGLTRDWYAATAAALVWMLAAYQRVWIAYPAFLGTLMWLPAVAALWERARRPQGLWAVGAGSLAAGMAILGGQVQFAVMGALFLAVYGMGRILADPGRRRRGLLAGAGVAVGGVAVATVHLLGLAGWATESSRSALTGEALLSTGLPWAHAKLLWLPFALGDPRLGTYAGVQNASETAAYVGLLPVAAFGVAVLALLARSARRDTVPSHSLLVLALCGCVGLGLIVFGTPAATLLGELPVVRLFPLTRWLAMWPLVAALLTGVALHAGAQLSPRGRLLGVAAGAALVAGGSVWVLSGEGGDQGLAAAAALSTVAALALWGLWPRSRYTQVGVLAVLGMEMLVATAGYTPSASRDLADPRLPPLDLVHEDAGGTLATAGAGREPFRVVTLNRDQIVLGPGVAPSVGLSEIGGYSSTPRRSYQAFVRRLSELAGVEALRDNANMVALGDVNPLLLAMLNVRYVLSDGPMSPVAREIVHRPVCGESQATDLDPVSTGGATPGPGRLVPVGPGRLERRFRVHADGLNRIDLYVDGSPAVEVTLSRDDGSLTAAGRLEPQSGPLRTWYFEPVGDSRGRVFQLTVESADDDRGAVVCVDAEGPVIDAWTTAPRYVEIGGDNGIVVHRAPTPLGPAWLVPEADNVPDQSAALDALTGPDFDPARVVIVEPPAEAEILQAAELSRTARSRSQEAHDGQGTGITDRNRTDSRDLNNIPAIRDYVSGPTSRRVGLTPGQRAAWLVLSDAYAPGWRAMVDGHEVPVRRANGGLMAVAVEVGASEVAVAYRPAAVAYGLPASGIAVAIALVMIGAGLPNRRRRP